MAPGCKNKTSSCGKTEHLLAHEARRIRKLRYNSNLVPNTLVLLQYRNQFNSELVQLYAIGNEICAITEYSVGVWRGYKAMIYVRGADTWKIRMAYSN